MVLPNPKYDLDLTAKELISAAEKTDAEFSISLIVEKGFPEELTRVLLHPQHGLIRFQLSVDKFQNKKALHLSFCLKTNEVPSSDLVEEVKKSFFSNFSEESIMILPSFSLTPLNTVHIFGIYL